MFVRGIHTKLGPVYSQAPAEGAAQGGGQGQQLPAGVQPGSAAAQALAAQQQQGQQSNTGGGQQSADGKNDDAGRAGGPEALKADLASERAKRHQLEQQVAQLQQGQNQQIEALKKALGLGEAQTPEQLAAAATAAQNELKAAQAQVSVARLAGKGGANLTALLDSRTFLDSLSKIDATNDDAVLTAIKSAVQANPALAAQRVGAGANDAGAGGGAGGQKPSFSDLIRAAAGHGS
jgi:hypothetical protein